MGWSPLKIVKMVYTPLKSRDPPLRMFLTPSLYRVKWIHTELYRVMNCDKESKRDVQIHTVKNGIILSWCLVDTQVPIPIPGWSVLIPILTKREVRNCRLRGNRLLFGYALTVFCHADSARPLIGCLDMNIMCWRQCSDQSEARIPVTARYGILAGVSYLLFFIMLFRSSANVVQYPCKIFF